MTKAVIEQLQVNYPYNIHQSNTGFLMPETKQL